jgi:hypothetical protein
MSVPLISVVVNDAQAHDEQILITDEHDAVLVQQATAVQQSLMQYITATKLDLRTSKDRYVYHTLIAYDDITLNLRVRGSATHNIAIVLYATKVSGTVTNTFVTYYSMDGVNYTSTGDTITLSNASTGLKGTINLDDYPYPYLRIKGAAGATAQKAYYKVFAISRAE